MERWLMACAWLVSMPALAQLRPACPQVLTYDGDPAMVDAIDGHLRDGMLRTVSASECSGTVITLQREGRRIRFRVERDTHTEEHVTDDLRSVATWIESWLLPVASIALETVDPSMVATAESSVGTEVASATGVVGSAVALEAAADDERPPVVDPESEHVRPAWRIPVRLDATASFDADRTAPIWWGGEANIGIEVRPKLWFAFAAGAHSTPNVNAESRRAARFSLRSGWMSHTETTEVRVGLGFGVGYARAEREVLVGGVEVEVADDAALAMVEGYWDVRYALSDHIGLVVGLVLRGNIPDGLNDRQPDPDDEPGEQLEPYPDSRGSISLRLGLSWGSR